MAGVFNTWTDVFDQIQDFPEAQWKGYHTLHEAFAVARSRIGLNYYVCPALRHYQDSSQEESTSQGFPGEQAMAELSCSSCQDNEETIKRLTYILDKQTSEEKKMIEESDRLQRELSAAKREIERLRVIERAYISTTLVPPQTQPSQAQTQTLAQMARPSQTPQRTEQVLPEDIMATINAMRTQDQARKEAKRAKKKQEMAEMIAMMLELHQMKCIGAAALVRVFASSEGQKKMEAGSSSFPSMAPPVFDGVNYQAWALEMAAYMEGCDLWEAMENDYEVAPFPENPTMNQIKYHKERTCCNLQ
ncbi:hypothetical protein CRG98_037788 [Punica granatum]|uniref:Ribonuclease H1 N-terminal domain-containing protein n=1 Tax=Punica granatum TaxID=22663 RepID=A0A2I0ICW3_PUNGR|nr:hypothetical protein CRG98_037788 [Punica granatum]